MYYLEKIYDVSEVYEQYALVGNMPYFYKFILNVNGSVVTEYNGDNYVLLLVNNNQGQKTPILINNGMYLNWRNIWIARSDYIEEYYDRIRGETPLINESFDYYMGLLEFAICYLGDDDYYGVGYLQHKHFDYNELNNPLNIKVDFLERDFAEYLKYIFITGEYKNIDMKELILENRYNYNFNLVIARIIYPNYYFNLLDDIIVGYENENILFNIIERNQEFEAYLKNIIAEISLIYPIKKIPFMRF
ncbi:MAG: hypothetical protein IJI22_04535 [Bacilli bacterium]|nr:hypothetical protein [Bacilli bacterium]